MVINLIKFLQISNLSMQIFQNGMKFSCSGLFEIDRSIITKVSKYFKFSIIEFIFTDSWFSNNLYSHIIPVKNLGAFVLTSTTNLRLSTSDNYYHKYFISK